MKVFFLHKIILLLLLKISIASQETEENKYFQIKTESDKYYNLYSLAKNQNKYKFLNIQIIFSKILSSKSSISLLDDNKILFETDITSTRNFIIKIEQYVESNLKFNATSPGMYIKYQYIEQDKDIILPSGKILDFDLNSNSLSLKIIPVLNNTETKYDLYYLGNIDYEDIYEKFIFSLDNTPIGSITKNITNNSDLLFENMKKNIGYYFIKGNNINELSYTYFYESIFVANKEKYYNTTDNEFFNINTTSNEHYSFYNINNTNKNNFLFFQIFVNEKERYSHFILLNEDSDEIWDTDIISHRQFIVDVKNENKKMKIMASSPEMYVKYQFIEEDRDIILPLGKIYDLDFTTNSISFGLIPPINNVETKFDLYYLGNNNSNNIYEKFIFSLNNNPIGSITKQISDKMILNFENIQKNIGYYFIKGNNFNELSYTYFYNNILLNNISNTTDNVFFNITTPSDEICSFYYINDTNMNNILNFQLFTKQKNDNFVLSNENNEIICNYIINNEKQFQVNITNQTKLRIKSNSTQMFIRYQYLEKDPQIKEIQGKLISFNSNSNDNCIIFEISPIIHYSNTTYELYFTKDNILNDTFNKLEYSFNHEPISTITIFGNEKVTLNFTYNFTSDIDKIEKGYAFVKANNINETNYIYFYGVVEASIHYNSKYKENPGVNLLPYIIIVIILLVIIVLYVLRSKQIICKKEMPIEVSGELIDDNK